MVWFEGVTVIPFSSANNTSIGADMTAEYLVTSTGELREGLSSIGENELAETFPITSDLLSAYTISPWISATKRRML
jgi:hypothetical protein